MELKEPEKEFVRLLAAHERRVGAYILTLVPNFTDADEILQETHVRLWEQRERFAPGTNFAAWAMRVAYFEVLSWRKRAERRPLVFDDALVERLSLSFNEVDHVAEARQAALTECLHELSGRSREILRRIYAEGERVKDIARDLGNTSDSLYKTVQRLRMALRECIEQRLVEEGAR